MTKVETPAGGDALAQGGDGRVCPEWFGARGDGATDDTAALQRALAATAESGARVGLGGRHYAVRSLRLENGMGGIVGPGTLRGLAESPVLVVGGSPSGKAPPVTGVALSGIEIEAGPAQRAILVGEARHTVIENCRIRGLRDQSRGIFLGFGCVKAVVRNCRIEAPRSGLVSLVCVWIESPTVDGIGAGYFLPPAGQPKYLDEITRDNIIDGNIIDGGTHGVLIQGAARNRMVNNTITHSMARNINICPVSRHNVVSNNNLLEAGSSAVAMAYGSSFNLVANNKIDSNAVIPNVDQDAIHSYVSCRHNMITGNMITGTFRYGVYMAVSPRGHVVQGNMVKLASKADVPGDFNVGIALENDWQARPLPEGARYSRQNFGPPECGPWGVDDAVGNVIQGNTVHGCTCGFYVAQLGPGPAVRANRWQGNTAIGCRYGAYAFGEAEDQFHSNELAGLVAEDCEQDVLLPAWRRSPFET